MVKKCDNCKHFEREDNEYPCSECRNTAIPGTEEYANQEFLWQSSNGSNVEHPAHYNHGKYECIEVMVENFGKEAVKHFCLLNAFKYVWRSDYKNGIEDVKKAMFYLDYYLKLEGEANE